MLKSNFTAYNNILTLFVRVGDNASWSICCQCA